MHKFMILLCRLIPDAFHPLEVDPITVSRGGNYSKNTSQISSRRDTPLPSSPAYTALSGSPLKPLPQNSSPARTGPVTEGPSQRAIENVVIHSVLHAFISEKLTNRIPPLSGRRLANAFVNVSFHEL